MLLKNYNYFAGFERTGLSGNFCLRKYYNFKFFVLNKKPSPVGEGAAVAGVRYFKKQNSPLH
jgi:hypothetical protein